MESGNKKALLWEEIIERVVSFTGGSLQDGEGIIISMPAAQLTDQGRERINSLNKALEQVNLPQIVIDGEKVSFPWYPYTENGDRVQQNTRHGRKFCVSDIRQNQEFCTIHVRDSAYFPCQPLSRQVGTVCAPRSGVNAGTACRES